MENYFQPKENLKTEENVNDFAEETVKNNMQEGDQNGDIQGNMQEPDFIEAESENLPESGVTEENFQPLNGENLQEKFDNFVLNDAAVKNIDSADESGIDSAENAAENLAENAAENVAESENKDRIENETGNFAYTTPSENHFKPQAADGVAFNKPQKQPKAKKMPFVFSMLGLLLSIFYIGLPFAIAGLVMTIIQKNKGETDELTRISFVLSFAGIAIGLFTLILFVFCLIF